MTNGVVRDLQIYPIKGMRALQLPRHLLPSDIALDRRFALVDSRTDEIINQKKLPLLAGFSVEREGGQLRCQVPTGDVTMIDLHAIPRSKVLVDARLYDRVISGYVVSTELSEWFSAMLGRTVRFIRVCDDQHSTGFSDRGELHICTTASLIRLNEWLRDDGTEPVMLDRFRPNIVIGGDLSPFAEETWRRFGLGESILDATERVRRCVVITTDQKTGVRAKSGQPTRSLIRRGQADARGKAIFGIYADLLRHDPGSRAMRHQTISIGDKVSLIG